MIFRGPRAHRHLTALAAVQLALAAAGGALPSLHLGVASRHHHLFCPVHLQFEDEALPAPAARAETRSDRQALATPDRTERGHAACALSNLLLRPLLAGARAHVSAWTRCLPLEPAALRGTAASPLSALTRAPKHSPPPAMDAS